MMDDFRHPKRTSSLFILHVESRAHPPLFGAQFKNTKSSHGKNRGPPLLFSLRHIWIAIRAQNKKRELLCYTYIDIYISIPINSYIIVKGDSWGRNSAVVPLWFFSFCWAALNHHSSPCMRSFFFYLFFFLYFWRYLIPSYIKRRVLRPSQLMRRRRHLCGRGQKQTSRFFPLYFVSTNKLRWSFVYSFPPPLFSLGKKNNHHLFEMLTASIYITLISIRASCCSFCIQHFGGGIL